MHKNIYIYQLISFEKKEVERVKKKRRNLKLIITNSNQLINNISDKNW